MIDYLTYYYRRGTEPFRTLSSLSDEEAIVIMKGLCDDTPFGERFKDPAQYMRNRRKIERWVRENFLAIGGKPQDPYPIPMVLGSSNWMVKNAPDPDFHGEIHIPLSVFTENDISFTYPDSMVSYWFAQDKPDKLYKPDFHGMIFTKSEILSIVNEKGNPEDDWETNLPDDITPYIEAQVWRHELLDGFRKEVCGS